MSGVSVNRTTSVPSLFSVMSLDKSQYFSLEIFSISGKCDKKEFALWFKIKDG